MSHLYLTVRPTFGSTISEACGEALDAARRLGLGVRFTFNEITVIAWPSSDVDALVSGWHKALGAAESERPR